MKTVSRLALVATLLVGLAHPMPAHAQVLGSACEVHLSEEEKSQLIQAHTTLETILPGGFGQIRETLIKKGIGTASSLPVPPSAPEDPEAVVRSRVEAIADSISIPASVLANGPDTYFYSGSYAMEQYDYLPTAQGQVDGNLVIRDLNTTYRLTEAATSWTPEQRLMADNIYSRYLRSSTDMVRSAQLAILLPHLNGCLAAAGAGFHYEVDGTKAVRVNDKSTGFFARLWGMLTWFIGSS
ncbi:MAG: hypothetical protein Q3972_09070 [Corynebacterium sp.]|nr:hypothetical protein [Corynebacterium sp.]